MNTNKKYQVVYADPPWTYSKGSFVLSVNGYNNTTLQKKKSKEEELVNHYPTMSVQEMMELPVSDVADKDCVLFMWTTDSHLPYALEIIKSWGFTYKTVGFVWNKTREDGGDYAMMGPWTMKQSEICLLATKGSPYKFREDRTVRSMVHSQKTKHSAKPQEVADRIVRMFPDCNRIELFARDAKPGWDVWGNEIQNTIEL